MENSKKENVSSAVAEAREYWNKVKSKTKRNLKKKQQTRGKG